MPPTPHAQVPLAKFAFDHAETRLAWQRARRRVAVRFVVCLILTLALLVVLSLLAAETAKGGLPGFALALLMGIFLPCVLYAYIGALLRLRRMRKVMRAYPWEHRAAARKLGGKDGGGIPMRLSTGPGDDDWTERMLARNPLRWNRWSAELENGAWFAGDPSFGGVVALPGGSGLMSLGRGSRMSPEDFRALGRDTERYRRAFQVGIARR